MKAIEANRKIPFPRPILLGSLFILGAIGILLALETGFQFRTWLDHQLHLASYKLDGRSRVLLIGDSVMGFDNDQSLAAGLGNALSQLKPSAYDVINVSEPANSSEKAESRIDAQMDRYRPKVVVLLLGRSDSIQRKPGPFVGSKLTRLYSLYLEKRRAWFSHHLFGPGLSELALLRQDSDFSHRREQLIEFRRRYRNRTDIASRYLYCYAEAMAAQIPAGVSSEDGDTKPSKSAECLDDLSGQNLLPELTAQLTTEVGRAYRLANETDEAERFLHEATKLDPDYYAATLELAWLYSSRLQCALAIPLFERILRFKPSAQDELIGLHKCYLQQKAFAAGRDFYREIESQSNLTRLLTSLSAILEGERNGPSHPKSKTPVEVEMPKDRVGYHEILWTARRLNQGERAAALFRNADQMSSEGFERLNQAVYKRLIEKIVARGARVIALQYPNDPDQIVSRIVSSYRHGVSFFSLREPLLDALDRLSVFQLLDHDFIHLTPTGAKICAEALAHTIAEYDSATPQEARK